MVTAVPLCFVLCVVISVEMHFLACVCTIGDESRLVG